MKPEELKQFADFMKEQGLTYLEVRKGDFKAILKKKNGIEAEGSLFDETVKEEVQEVSQEQIIKEFRKETQHLGTHVYVKSPLVGTFYRASSPHAAHFVEIGSQVRKGDVLCIIEAMKVMNELKAEEDGAIKEILVENGRPVEFGEVLFVLEAKPNH